MPEATGAGRVRQGLIVLTLINLFNYLDRFVVPSLLESIKKSELHPSDTQLFSLVPAFTVVYMLAAPVFGPLGDRRARPPLIAALALRRGDRPRGAQEADGGGGREAPPRVGWSAYAALARNRPYVLTVLGYAAYTFALGGIVSVMPSFLQRIRGLPEIQATFRLGAATVGTGLVATLAGGWLGDRLLARTSQAYLWLSGLATLVAAPLAFLALAVAAPAVYWTSIVAAELLLFASTGLINSAIVNVVPAATRATAVAVSILAIHLL